MADGFKPMPHAGIKKMGPVPAYTPAKLDGDDPQDSLRSAVMSNTYGVKRDRSPEKDDPAVTGKMRR